MMRDRNLSDPEVYKAATIDRKTWSKLISNPNQRPAKRNVCAIAIALKLKYKECKHLVKAAGYILNRDSFDLTIRYCIEHQIYDPFEVDRLLVEQHLKPLFSEWSIQQTKN